jgi:hypothetical protein
MSLSDLASIAGALSSLAVFGSLIYLALQVRQTDRNQRTLLQQATSARNMESIWKFGEPHNVGIVARVWNGESDFTQTEATQLAYLVRSILFGLQDQFLLNRLSLVDATQAATAERGVQRIFSAPAFRALWTMNHSGYAPEFAAYVEALLQDVPIAGPQDFAGQIKTAVAQMKAAATVAPQAT